MARRGPGCKRKWHDSLVLGSADGGDREAIIGILIRGVRAEEIRDHLNIFTQHCHRSVRGILDHYRKMNELMVDRMNSFKRWTNGVSIVSILP